MNTRADPNAGKFAEPRSWAAKWCGYGLSEKQRSSTERSRVDGTFAEPRGWSVKWCAAGLGEGPRRRR